jgi:hypothetical protein
MNDSEFFELLNLYLDHEIPPASAARLEAEVQTNPERRRIYQQYCRMQKACRVLAADFQTDLVDAAIPADRKVVAFSSAASASASRHKRVGALYTLGTLAAAAACVALIFVGRTRDAASPSSTSVSSQSVAVVPPAPPAAKESVAPVAPPSAITNPDATFVVSKSAAPRGLVSVAPRPRLARDPFLLTGNSQADAVYAAAVHQADSQLAWIESVQLAPLPQRTAADLHFTATLQSERALGNRSSMPAKSSVPADEMVTFQFRK